jgi:hypothetical protein
LRDSVDELEALRAQERQTARASLLHRPQIARRAVGQQPVRKFLLHDVRREESVELPRSGARRQARDVLLRDLEIVHG